MSFYLGQHFCLSRVFLLGVFLQFSERAELLFHSKFTHFQDCKWVFFPSKLSLTFTPFLSILASPQLLLFHFYFFSISIPSSLPFPIFFFSDMMEKQFVTASSSRCGCCSSYFQILNLGTWWVSIWGIIQVQKGASVSPLEGLCCCSPSWCLRMRSFNQQLLRRCHDSWLPPTQSTV